MTRHSAIGWKTNYAARIFVQCPALLFLLLHFNVGAGQPVRLTRYPQKFRTFFSLQDTNVPRAALSNSVPLPVAGITAAARASDGATWLGTTQGLLRLDFSAPQKDQRQYFAGRRYLPDDRVNQI